MISRSYHYAIGDFLVDLFRATGRLERHGKMLASFLRGKTTCGVGEVLKRQRYQRTPVCPEILYLAAGSPYNGFVIFGILTPSSYPLLNHPLAGGRTCARWRRRKTLNERSGKTASLGLLPNDLVEVNGPETEPSDTGDKGGGISDSGESSDKEAANG